METAHYRLESWSMEELSQVRSKKKKQVYQIEEKQTTMVITN